MQFNILVWTIKNEITSKCIIIITILHIKTLLHFTIWNHFVFFCSKLGPTKRIRTESLIIANTKFGAVDTFSYLWDMTGDEVDAEENIVTRMRCERQKFWELLHYLIIKDFSLLSKGLFYQACACNVFIYAGKHGQLEKTWLGWSKMTRQWLDGYIIGHWRIEYLLMTYDIQTTKRHIMYCEQLWLDMICQFILKWSRWVHFMFEKSLLHQNHTIIAITQAHAW